MIQSIVSFFIRKPRIGHLILILIVLGGFFSFKATVNQGYPTVDFGLVTVTTPYRGASAEEIESDITIKLEKELKSIAGIDYISSMSMEGVSQIFIKLQDGYDFDTSKDDIQKAVDRVSDLPKDLDSRPIVFEMDNDAIPSYELAITGDAPYEKKRFYADILERRLRISPYVGEIQKVGYLKRETKIELSQNKLKDYYVSIGEVITAIQAHNIRVRGGDIQERNEDKEILIDSEYGNISQLERVIIRSGFEGNSVQLKDVANVQAGFEKQTNIIRHNGNDAVILVINKKPDADIRDVSKDIVAITEALQLPPNINVHKVANYTQESFSLFELVKNNSYIGLALILITLMVLLNIRVAIWTALGIPISILIGFMFFPLFDVTINFISLIAILIVLGMLVDDAILVSENIFYYREKGLKPKEASLKGIQEVMWPVITTISTTVIAFLPMLFMKGTMGKFMFVLPIVVTLVLIGSLIESLLILPFHLAHTPYKKRSKPIIEIFPKIEPLYRKWVHNCFTHKTVTILAFLGIFFISIFLLLNVIKFKLFASDDGLMAYIQFETEAGTQLEETADRATQLEDLISTTFPNEVASYVTNIGERKPRQASNFISTESSGGSFGNIMVHLTKGSDRDITSKEMVGTIRDKVKNIPGFTEIKVESISEGPPVGRPVTVRFVSSNDTLRNTYADQLIAFLEQEPGVLNIEDTRTEGKTQIKLQFKQDLMARLGITPADVAQTIQAAYTGVVATDITQNGEEMDFRVVLTSTEQTQAMLPKLTVRNRMGKLIPLGQVLKVNEAPHELGIYHYDGERSTTVFADIDENLANSAELNKKIMATFTPLVEETPDVRLFFGGEEKESQESMASLFSALIMALIGIYFALVILFNSFSQPFLVMVAIPYSFSGVIFAFSAHNIPLSFPAMIGMVGLIGVVVNNSLVMITFLNNARNEHGLDINKLADAATRRLRPILLTSFTTAAALFPTAYGFGGDNPVIIPMVMALAWGLVFSTIISLFLIPSLYVTQYSLVTRLKAKLKSKK